MINEKNIHEDILALLVYLCELAIDDVTNTLMILSYVYSLFVCIAISSIEIW